MNRFDIAVVLVTFAVLGVAALIRGIVVPVVRFRVKQHLAASPPARDDDVTRLRAQVGELEQRNSELESRLAVSEPTKSSTAVIKDQL